MIDFNNSKSAFKDKSDFDLNRAFFLFQTLNYPTISKFLTIILKVILSLRIPINFLIKGSKGKLPVRNFLKKRIPEEILEGPKTGFGVPIEYWLKNNLKPWAESLLLSSNNLENIGLDYKKIMSEWDKFQNYGLPLHHDFWNILMLLAWYEEHSHSL